jgi:hypothetical protein
MDGSAHVLYDCISLWRENSIRAFEVGSKIYVDVQQYRIAAVAGAHGGIPRRDTRVSSCIPVSQLCSCGFDFVCQCILYFMDSHASAKARVDYFIYNFEHSQ